MLAGPLLRPASTVKKDAASTDAKASTGLPTPRLAAASAAVSLPVILTIFQRCTAWDPVTRVQLLNAVNILNTCKQPDQLAQLYQKETGRSLASDLIQRLVGAPTDLRERVMRRYSQPLKSTLDFDAFVEQLAISAAYSNNGDLSDAKQSKSTSSVGTLLDAMGYKAEPTVHGRWGLQFRLFRPVSSKKPKFKETVIAFRGTEGVSMPWQVPDRGGDSKQVESVRDTVVGDMNRLGPGYGQYNPNRDLIRVQLKHAAQSGRLVSTGHSLGGALAQIAGADNPEFIQSVVSFASPGIDDKDVQQLRQWNKTHAGQAVDARHYRASGDIVPGGGEQRLDGEIFSFDRYVVTRTGGREVFTTRNGTAGAAAHNAFVLHDFLARVPRQDLTEVQKIIVQYGSVDSTAFTKGEFDPKTITATVLRGIHDAQRDPTVQSELARKYVTPFMYGVTATTRLLQDLPYEVLMDRTDKALARLSAAQVRQAGGLSKALRSLQKKILETESIILTMEDVKFFGMLDRDDLGALGMTQAAFDIPRPIEVNERQALAVALPTRWRYWHPGADGVK